MEPVALQIAQATAAQGDELADVAARAFPLACPPTVSPPNVAAFIAANLSAARFHDYLADPDRTILMARDGATVVGYVMLVAGVGDQFDVQDAVTLRPAVELSKMYVLPHWHGTGAAAALLRAALDRARGREARCVWLGVNHANARAQRFYTKHGFTVAGTRTFRLGTDVEHDFVMTRPLGADPRT